MMKYFKIIVLSIILFNINSVYGENLDDLVAPKSPMYRLGTSYDVEKEYKVTDLTTKKSEVNAYYDKNNLTNKTYADSSLKEISKEIGQLVAIDKSEMFEDIQVLWVGAATKSETIKFALFKLSNPDADKPNDTIIKKIIRPLSTVSSIAGAGLGDPISATTALISGQLLHSLSLSDKDLNYKYTKVTDSDMIVLLSKVENLQRKLITEYMDYMTTFKMLRMTEENVKRREARYNAAQGTATKEQLLVLDAFYRSALDNKRKLEFEFFSRRATLEQLAGPEAMQEFEVNLIKRTKENQG